MAKLMWICGILLFAAGVALGVILLLSAARPGGIDIQTAVTLLVGGILALGIGGVIDALADIRPQVAAVPSVAAPVAPIPEFDPRGAKMPASTPDTVGAAADEEMSRPTRDTIKALEQARQKIEQAFDTRETTEASEAPVEAEAPAEVEAEAEAPAEAEDAVVEEEAVAEEEVMDDGQLYVVEERVIRRHPARILSDGTVEAETAEGWMRFENLEHLDEYLDAMEPARN